MPPVVAAAAIGAVATAGTAVYGASQQKKATNKALDAQNQAAERQLAAQQQVRDQALSLNQPRIDGGNAAYSALLARYGLKPSATQTAQTTTPTAAPAINYGAADGGAASVPTAANTNAGGSPDWSAYGAANPDVAAEGQRVVASGQFPDLNSYYQYHYQTYGQNEGRQLPTASTTAAPVTYDAPTGPQTPTDLMTATRPDAQPLQTFTRPSSATAPDLASYLGDFKADPGYQFRLSEGLNGVNAASAARGKLRSGDAAMALQAHADGLASQEYNNFFNRGLAQYTAARAAYDANTNRADQNFNNDRAYDTSVWNYNTNRADQNFNTDRQYQTGVYNQDTQNLFNLSNAGQNAINSTVNAGSAYANNASNIYQNQANAAGDAAYANGQANAGLFGGVAGAASNLFANWGGSNNPGVSTTAATAYTPQTSYAGVTPATLYNPTNLSTINTGRIF